MCDRSEMVPRPVITIAVADTAAALAKIEAAGGRQVGETMQVGDMGFSAYFTDSEGNLMGLWQSA